MGGDRRIRLLDASRPAAEQVQVFQAIGWPSGPPSAGYLKNKLVARAEQRYQTAYDRIAGRHPGLRVCFPMTVGAYARAGMGGICDPVYTLSHDSDDAESDERSDLSEVGDMFDETDGAVDPFDESEEVDESDDD